MKIIKVASSQGSLGKNIGCEKAPDRIFEELEKNASPLGRRLVPDEVAALTVFLATEAASGINGQLLNVCGGRVLAA